MKRLYCPALVLLFLVISCNPPIEMGVVRFNDDSIAAGELESVVSPENVCCSFLDMSSLPDLGRFDIIWYDRPDSSSITEAEDSLGRVFCDYVAKGGKLVLSNDAVRLLNVWGIEDTPICVFNYDAVDEGFGRKAGFRGFRTHPVFDGMNGGAYVWHGHEDNTCRILGFPEGRTPSADGAKVIATFWEYIFYHPEQKVVWETPLGEGSILAIGGLLNYGKPNYNKALLDRFTNNCVKYLCGTLKTDQVARCWEYPDSVSVFKEHCNHKKIRFRHPEKWVVGDDPHSLKWEATANEFNIASPETAVICQEKGGIVEIWTHPFMSARDFKVFAKKGGRLIPLCGEGIPVELRSNSIIRSYVADGSCIEETITASTASAAVIAHYEWEDPSIEGLLIEFKSNLRYMWPYAEDALGSIRYGWDEGLNAFIASDCSREFVSIVGSDVPAELLASGRYSGFEYSQPEISGVPTDLLQVCACVSLDAAEAGCCNVIFAAGTEDDAVKDYSEAVSDPFGVFESNRKFHDDYMSSHTSVISPDPVFNEGYYWALLSSEQFRVSVPGMGPGLFAGYSSSRRGWGGGQRVSGRPGYAWFFGRDSEWSSLAFLDWGDSETVKNVLEMLIRYQRIDGKIYHEASSSGSVHYDSADGTPFFVVLMGRYLKATGDVKFIKENIGAVHKALSFCKSTDTNGDLLLENVNVGHGWLEGGDFYGSITELVIATLYCRALFDASEMCGIIGETACSEEYGELAGRIRDIINNEFWNPSLGYYSFGKNPDGTFKEELLSLVSSCVYFGDTEYEKSRATMKRFETLNMRRDWGVKSIADTCSYKLSYSAAYTEDNIWPLFTGTCSLSEYEYGLYDRGFEHIMQNMLEYAGDCHGRIPEVLSGYTHKSCGITRNQCWSETMTVQSVIEGMLGFCPDAMTSSLTLAPRIPLMWNTLTVSGLKVGNASVDMEMQKSSGVVTYALHSSKALSVRMKPSFGIGTTVRYVKVDGKEVAFDTVEDEEYSTISLAFRIRKDSTVEIGLDERVAPVPHYHASSLGENPHEAIIMHQELTSDGALSLVLQGHAGKSDSFTIYAPNGISTTDGAVSYEQSGDGLYSVSVEFPGEGPYVTRNITIYQ